MAYGRREGFSYADGIPLKLSDRLRPPLQVVLPTIRLNPPNLLENEYDFSVEKRALHQFEAHRLAKEAHERAKVEKVGEEIEHFAQIPLDTGQPINNISSIAIKSKTPSPKDIEPKKEMTKNLLPAWPTAEILNPQPLVNETLIIAKTLPAKPLNFADFESQSSSPFDMMELQTLNDLEELNTVFQGMTTHAPKNHSSMTASGEDYAKVLPQPPNGYQVSLDARLYSSYVSNDRTQPIDNGHSIYPTSVTTNSSLVENWEGNYFPRLKSSKSTPDIRDEMVQDITTRYRSQTPPPSCQLPIQAVIAPELSYALPTCQTPRSGRSSSLCLPPEDSRGPLTDPLSLPRVTKNVSVVPSNEPSDQMDNLPNPYPELEESQQQFAATVAQMGFQLDRVARTVKHLGIDDKKVVDHLCHVQSLEESGYEGNDAETALHLYDYNIQEAKRFLDLLKQFQDLGFPKNAARKALIRHKNDRDRALDFLLLS